MLDEYRPPGFRVSDDEWDSWMVEMLNSTHMDPTIFNQWWYNKTRSEAMEHILADLEEESARTPRKKYRSAKALPASTKRMMPVRSLTSYGDLFFGTEFGYHRQLKKSPRGTKEGVAGNFVLVLSTGSETSHGRRQFKIGNKTFGNWAFKDVMAAGNALSEEAAEREDKFSLITVCRNWENAWDNTWADKFGNKKDDSTVVVEYFDRDGSVYVKDSLKPCQEGLWGRGLFGCGRADWSTIKARKGTDTKGTPATISPPLFWNTTDYDKVHDWFLRMPPIGSGRWQSYGGGCAKWPQVYEYLAKALWPKLDIMKRGTIVVIGSTDAPGYLMHPWKQIEFCDQLADVWFFDLGPENLENYFFGEEAVRKGCTRVVDGKDTKVPLFINGGKRIMNYVWVEDIGNLTEAVLRALR